MSDIKPNDLIALTEDIKATRFLEEGEILLRRGLVGTIVEELGHGEAYEIEFSRDTDGQAYAMISIEPEKFMVLHNEPLELVAG
ncbi:MAG: DUF4926 domain-containing protein [Cyanobacteria bacterium J06634_6]